MNRFFQSLGYVPNAGQRRFHESPAAFKCGLAGIGGGKTRALCVEALRLALENPGSTGLIAAPTWDMLATVVVPTFRGIAPRAVRWSPSQMCATLDCDAGERGRFASKILFRTAGVPDHLRGTNLAWFAMDEAARCDPAAWEILLGRVRVRGAARPAGVVVSTPNGRDWLFDQFAGDKAAALGRELIRWRTQENAANLRPGYVEELRAAYSPEFARQELDAEFIAMAGAVFAEFRREAWPAGNLVRWSHRGDRPTWLGLDFGYRRPAAVWVQEVSGFQLPVSGSQLRGVGGDAVCSNRKPETENREPAHYIVFDEFAPQDCPIDRFIAGVKARPYPLNGVFGDPAGTGCDSGGESDIRRFADAGIFVRVCRSHRSRVLFGVQQLMSLVRSDAGARRLLLATDEAGRCRAPATLEALERYRWPGPAAGARQAAEPVKDGIHDHAIDAMRYWAINALDRPAGIGGVGRRE